MGAASGKGAAAAGSLPSGVQSSADLASNLPSLRGILGPPAYSMARALANWMRSAQETSGQESLMGERSLRAMSRALLAP